MTNTRTDAVAETELDPTTDAAAEQVRPPRDYPFPEWQHVGDFAVPDSLRPFYAAAEPSDLEKQGYIQFGVSIGEPVTVTRQRVVSAGRDDGEPIVVEEPDTVTTLRDLHGAADYPRWLHIARVQLAVAARRRAEARAVTESRYLTCDVCGVRHSGVHPVTVYPGPVHMSGCSQHVLVLDRAARAAVESRAAGRLLPDGRLVGDVAAEVVADRLARLDGAS